MLLPRSSEWGSVGLRAPPEVPGEQGGRGGLIPTKTSEFVTQSSVRSGEVRRSEGYHVLFTISCVTSFLFHFKAMYLSEDSRWLILLYHRVFTTPSVWSVPCITRSQRNIQIRWADSDSRIRSRRDFPGFGRLLF